MQTIRIGRTAPGAEPAVVRTAALAPKTRWVSDSSNGNAKTTPVERKKTRRLIMGGWGLFMTDEMLGEPDGGNSFKIHDAATDIVGKKLEIEIVGCCQRLKSHWH
jgi:hypothetical protein